MLQQQSQESTWSYMCAIIYTVAWSVSFYGQIYQNYKLKSVEGFSLDYLILNICGYTFYGIYSTIGFFTDIKGAGTVLLGDLIFVYHAIPMVIILAIQCVIYPRGKNKISHQALILAVSLWILILAEAFLTTILQVIPWTEYWNPVSSLGYAKLVVSLTKYSPAVYWNYKRKSTKGWSIFNIILDLIGGAFSLMSGSISVSNGLNLTKLMLAFLTIFYDLIFVFQHYVLYRPSKKKNQLLPQSHENIYSINDNEGKINNNDCPSDQQIKITTQVQTKFQGYKKQKNDHPE